MVLEAIENRGGASTSEVADEIGSSRRLALRRLRELEDGGQVTSREIGNTYLWEVEDDG
jgi:GTP-sensing pleiotropic transcriptional regulator CodY